MNNTFASRGNPAIQSQRREISYRTKRGQVGAALAGKSVGGRAFGYIPAALSGTGQEEIDPQQAEVVLRIFTLYADGSSGRAIATRFNAEQVPSPGANWNRTRRRKDGRWLASAIVGDPKRGTGILNNERYIGVLKYGRSQWDRAASDSSKRRVTELEQPRVRVVTERLRIVPQELWDRAKARQALQSRDLGVRVRTGLRKRCNKTKHLLSGSLRCQQCRAAFALSGGQRYQCTSHTGGGDETCSISLSVPRDRIERVFREYMAGPELPRALSELEAQWLSSQPPAG